MKIKVSERHVVFVYKTYEVDDDELIREFESIENFKKAFDDGIDNAVLDFVQNHGLSDQEEFWLSESEGTVEQDWEIL
jgi:hypothetical protein